MPTLSGDGDGAAVIAKNEDVTLVASGTFGGGTLAFQTYGDDAAWHTVGSLTANGYLAFKNKGQNQWRVSLSGSSTPSIWYEVR
jgi:hypothetical protein